MAIEEHVIAPVLAGETSEFRKLVEQFHLPDFRFARNLIGDENDAEDITQEVFLAAFNHLESYRAVLCAMDIGSPNAMDCSV